MRAKWSAPIRKYWKISEQMMVKYCDLAICDSVNTAIWRKTTMEFFNQAITVLQTLVVAIGAGLGVWGVVNLMEGYGNDNPGANAHVR